MDTANEAAMERDAGFLRHHIDVALTQLGEAPTLARLGAAVEAARAWRTAPDAAGRAAAASALRAQLGGRDAAGVRATHDVVRAAAMQLLGQNLAERLARMRKRRAYLAAGEAQPGSLVDVVRRLVAAGVTRDELDATLARLRLMPVFTAHPTEATRRSLLRKERRVAQRMQQLTRQDLLAEERARREAAIRSEFAAMWQTDEAAAPPTVADEVEHVLFYLVEVVYDVVPTVDEALHAALDDAFGSAPAPANAKSGKLAAPAEPKAYPTPLRFGSWVGGDMDGNPNVHAGTLAHACARHRQRLVERYLEEVAALTDALSQSSRRVAVSDELRARLAQARKAAPDVVVPLRHAGMPYREVLHHVAHRLRATVQEDAAAYPSAVELEGDVGAIVRSLQAHGGAHAGGYLARRLWRRVQTFGLHLATLDVRQASAVHRRVLAALGVQLAGEAQTDNAQRLAALREAWPEVERLGRAARDLRKAAAGRRAQGADASAQEAARCLEVV